MTKKEIGKITHYFGKISVAVLNLSDELQIGDKIHIKGKVTDFEQVVSSMQVEHKNITWAKKGDDVGLKVDQKVCDGDIVYKIIE